MDSAQWNTEALGADKLGLAKDLLLRMKQTFAQNGLLHYGQGKWYPGEEVPRWALGCFWRLDGEPLWRDAKWLARVLPFLTHANSQQQCYPLPHPRQQPRAIHSPSSPMAAAKVLEVNYVNIIQSSCTCSPL